MCAYNKIYRIDFIRRNKLASHACCRAKQNLYSTTTSMECRVVNFSHLDYRFRAHVVV